MKQANTKLKHWLVLNCLAAGENIKQATKTNKPKARIFLGPKFPDIYFTQREAQCVYQLLQQKKRKEIAKQLGLSIRTVEAYITEAKIKVKSHSQKELILTVSKTDFLKNYLEGMLIKPHNSTELYLAS